MIRRRAISSAHTCWPALCLSWPCWQRPAAIKVPPFDAGSAHAGADPLDNEVALELRDGADDDHQGAAERPPVSIDPGKLANSNRTHGAMRLPAPDVQAAGHHGTGQRRLAKRLGIEVVS